jgi:peptidoglycan/LPS O-acetylase OafA/YrhL
MVFSIVISSAVVMELFFGISAFFFSYRMFQLAEANDGALTFSDVIKAWTRKLLRLAPIYYAIFFIGWGMFPRVSSGPIWYEGAMMYETCSNNWWA